MEKISNSMKKEFDSEPKYNEKYLETKIKSYDGKVSTNFHNGKTPKEGSQYIYLLITLIDSVYRADLNC